ncbi:MAG: hypothetical protein LRZ96_00800, partial [Candidatus Pacebacteria bacterium]|nr:hypothetical protein [Candidatus Paceibacterota bacterium]
MFQDIKKRIFLIVLIFLLIPILSNALEIGTSRDFFIVSDLDLKGRQEISASLQKKSAQILFYIEDKWWVEIEEEKRAGVLIGLTELVQEFENNIRPKLTEIFGPIACPGIDNDKRITVLVHQMEEEVGGYFNQADGHSRIQVPMSNEREMIYINTFHINKPWARAILAHEFIHLITFNQKNLLQGIREEIWLNDVRAEFASTLLGYDDIFRGSNLERRLEVFSDNPSDSLTEWREGIADYGIVNLFAQYLV